MQLVGFRARYLPRKLKEMKEMGEYILRLHKMRFSLSKPVRLCHILIPLFPSLDFQLVPGIIEGVTITTSIPHEVSPAI